MASTRCRVFKVNSRQLTLKQQELLQIDNVCKALASEMNEVNSFGSEFGYGSYDCIPWLQEQIVEILHGWAFGDVFWFEHSNHIKRRILKTELVNILYVPLSQYLTTVGIVMAVNHSKSTIINHDDTLIQLDGCTKRHQISTI